MATAEVQVIDAKEIEQKALSIPEQARSLKIVDDTTYQRGGEILVAVKGLRKQIDACFDPIIKKAYEAHKEAKAQKTKVEAPLVEGEGILKSAMATYNTEQERRAEEARQRAEADARKRAEDEQVAAAAQAETEGDKATAEAILNAPVEVAPIVAPPPSPKVAGVSYRENWSAQVTDTMALIKAVAAGEQPVTLLQVNLPALNQMARALKGAMRLPGVKAVCEKVVSAGSR